MAANKKLFMQGLLLAALVIALDQGSKWAVLTYMPQPVVEVTNFFNLALVWNHGISFGIFAGQHQPVALMGLSLIILSILLKWMYKNTLPAMALALGLIIGGALGNVLDRARFGAVEDFFDAHIGAYHWPAFNLADSAIFIGVVLLCASSMLERRS